MALNEIEFVGNDRYFKYRYTQETIINCSIPWTDKDTTDFKDHIKFMAEYLKRFLNIKLNFKEKYINFAQLLRINDTPNFFTTSHVVKLEKASSFFLSRMDYYNPSPPVGINEMTIVSSPQVTTSNSWSFLNMDNEVVFSIALTLILLSLIRVIHSIVTNKYKSVPTKKVAKKMARETLQNFWENASLLCAEPIPSVLPHITCRLLASSWLVGVTFILFFLGCYMRTDFSTESYNCIDTLSDLIKSGIEPAFLTYEDRISIKNLAAQDPVVNKWLDDFFKKSSSQPPKDYYNKSKRYKAIDFFTPLFSGEKALIVNKDFLIMHLKEIVHVEKMKQFFVENGGFYFSQQALKLEYKHIIFNTSWNRLTPQLNAQLVVEPILEKQVFKYQEQSLHRFLEPLTWKRPLQSTEAFDLRSVSVPFYLLLMLLSGTVTVVFTEIFFY